MCSNQYLSALLAIFAELQIPSWSGMLNDEYAILLFINCSIYHCYYHNNIIYHYVHSVDFKMTVLNFVICQLETSSDLNILCCLMAIRTWTCDYK